MTRSETLIDALRLAARLDVLGLTFLDQQLNARDYSWAEVASRASALCEQLIARGLGPGDRLALLIDREEDFVFWFLAAVLGGIIAVPMAPLSPYGRQEPQLARAAAILRRSGARGVVAARTSEESLSWLQAQAPSLSELIRLEALPEATLAAASNARVVAPQLQARPSDPCLLQFTSGSTAEPKGVIVTHGNLVANVQALHARLGSDPARDVGVNWAPLFHDLGLVSGVVTPLLSLGRQVYLPTSAFAARPQLWLEAVHRHRGTMLSSNNFGLRAATKRLPRVEGLDLSCVRVISVGAEPIQPETLERFALTFEPFGLDARTLTPAYGMAEATLAITAGDPRTRFRSAAPAGDEQRSFVSCGRPVAGHDLAIFDEQKRPLAEGAVGQIAFRGASVTPGYFEDEAATSELLWDGWLLTGDRGFVHDGELFVCGRIKDLVIVAGRNYAPQGIEWAAMRAPGVRRDYVVAFSLPGDETERLVVVAESEHPRRTDGLAEAIRVSVLGEYALRVDEVVVVAPWTLPKTSSGKLRRAAVRQLYERGALHGHAGLQTSEEG